MRWKLVPFGMMRVNLPYLSEEIDRHGMGRLYVRRFGRRIRIRAVPSSPGFLDAYRGALAALGGDGPQKAAEAIAPPPAGSLAALGERYFASAEFKQLAERSQTFRRRILVECFNERIDTRDGQKQIGHCPAAEFNSRLVRWLRDQKASTPGAANNRKVYLSAMFGWAVEAGHINSNPCRDVRKIRYASEGFHTWTPDEVAQFEARHPIGSKARLAIALLLFTGVRRGDLVTLGRQHIRDGWLRFVPRKTRHKRQRMSEKPILPVLADILKASPCGDLTFLVNRLGKPFTAGSFGNWFRKRCKEAGLSNCSPHGLRKAGATLAAENGATIHELMSIFDWDTPAQAKRYTEAADRKRLAGSGMGKLIVALPPEGAARHGKKL